MADLDAQLSISADASGVEAGVGRAGKALSNLGKSAATAGRDAGAGLDAIGAGADKADARTRRATSNIQSQLQRTIAAAEAGSRSTSKYFETIAQQRGADLGTLRPFLDELDAVNAKQAAASAVLGKGGVELNKYGISAKQTAAAMRGVPAQLTDIIVGLQGGQAPLTVLLQQGGQLKDMFGGIVPAARALGTAALGLVNPFTLSAAAVLGLVVAYEKGRRESDAFNRALIFSGNAAGSSTGQLQLMAQNIDAITGTQSAASAALTQFAATGAVAASNLEQFTTAAILFEKAGGGAIGETAKKFADLRKAPLDAVVKLNEGMNFLTQDVYLQVRALEDQGRTAEAAAVAQKAFADAINSRSKEVIGNLGLIERGWKGIKSAISEAIDAAANIGRVASPDVQLAQTRKNIQALEELQRSRLSRGQATGDIDPQLAAARALVETQSEIVRLSQRGAAGQAQQAAAVKSLVEFDKLRESALTNQEKRQREIAKATELARQAGVKQADLDKVLAGINEKYKDPKTTSTARVDARAQARLDIEAIQSAAAAQIEAVSNAERIIEALRASGIVNESAYYDEKRRLLEENTRLQVAAIEQENERLSKETLNKKDGLDRDREILKNQAQIAKIQASSATQAIILNAQETSSIKQKAAAILTARQAAEDYLATQNRQQERILDGIGQGNQQRNRDAGISQIEDRYAGQRRDLENQRAQLEFEGRFTDEAREQYAKRLAIINEFQGKSISSFIDYYDDLTATQGNWALGAQESMRNYADDTRNAFAQVGDLVTSSFRGMEDALVNFVKTGKLDFKSLADSIISDLARIAAKKVIAGVIGNLFGGSANLGTASGSDLDLFYGGPRASGGPVSAGKTYLIGEKGPELLTMGSSGMVTPNHALGGQVTVNVINQGGGNLAVTSQTQRRGQDGSLNIDVVVQQLKDSIADDIGNGSGSIVRSMEGRFGLRTAVG